MSLSFTMRARSLLLRSFLLLHTASALNLSFIFLLQPFIIASSHRLDLCEKGEDAAGGRRRRRFCWKKRAILVGGNRRRQRCCCWKAAFGGPTSNHFQACRGARCCGKIGKGIRGSGEDGLDAEGEDDKGGGANQIRCGSAFSQFVFMARI